MFSRGLSFVSYRLFQLPILESIPEGAKRIFKRANSRRPNSNTLDGVEFHLREWNFVSEGNFFDVLMYVRVGVWNYDDY
jgi:hypothetical protein